MPIFGLHNKGNPILVALFPKTSRLSFCLPLLFLLGSLFNSFSVYSQNVMYGPKLGGNVSMFRGQFPYKGQKGPRLGYTFGGFLNFKSLKNKQFQFEINFLYTARGNNAKFTDPDDTVSIQEKKVRFSLGYIEIPLLFKLMLNRGGTIRPYVFAGPVYSGLVHARQKTITGVTKQYNAKNWFKKDDFGVMVGWGLTNFIIDRWYTLDIRYYHGFLNQSDNVVGENLYEFTNQNRYKDIIKIRNSTLSVTLSVGLNRQTFFR